MSREKMAGFGLDDRDQVNGFHKIFILCIFRWRDRPVVGLAAQFGDVSLKFGVCAQFEDGVRTSGVKSSVNGSSKRSR